MVILRLMSHYLISIVTCIKVKAENDAMTSLQFILVRATTICRKWDP